MNKQEFINDEKTQSSVLYQLVIMGEAVNRLSEQFKNQHPQIPFNEIPRHEKSVLSALNICTV